MLLAFIMQLTLLTTTINAHTDVVSSYDIYKLLSTHGFQSIGDKFRPQLQGLSETLNKFFNEAATDQAGDVPFMVDQDFGQLATDLARAMNSYGQTLINKPVVKKVSQAATLLNQLAIDIHTKFGPLVKGQTRPRQSLYSQTISSALVGLSGMIGPMLNPEDRATKFLPVIVDFFGQIGRSVDDVLKKQLPNLKAPAVADTVKQFDQKWVDTMKQIDGIFKS
ncbi:uncharacterized protein LOC128953165 [Oppia nitens]|uniref:uncharacterized protein LOC128953165 n=1 Tax=Oppia nitens TaxID=1686743 RepID=UPI0023DC8864|nr:uncharacterized protein LOC128953165 [Oppia nitens]